MRLSEILTPDRVPVGQGGSHLYHVTDTFGLIGMLKDGHIGEEGQILSLTRDIEYFVNGNPDGYIQIVLDRASLERTHAVEPHEEVWIDSKTGETVSSGESEERIWEHPVPFNRTYVVQINAWTKLSTEIELKLEKLEIPLKYF